MNRVKSATQPLCHWCGKPLRKWTHDHDVPKELTIRTKAEAQKLTNQTVVSLKYWETPPEQDYDGLRFTPEEKLAKGRHVYRYATWDGESYRAVCGFFCSNNCAMDLGNAATQPPHNVVGKAYNDALRKRRA